MKAPEILAPAGGCEELKAAVLHGADAVYFGVSLFNARIMADNFTTENLSEWVDYCHFFGVKAYLTLNTVIKNAEIAQLIDVVTIATRANVDAFIVCDLATVEICKNVAPDIPLHLSTQFGIHNKEGAEYAKKLGAKRIILSRETPLSEIKRIREVDIEIEVFVHGALCVSFSGNCYLSSSIDGNSGNRGRCKQPCRKKYRSSMSDKEGYFLSTNDLCLAERARDLADLGINSLKIEGRLKSPEYVASAVRLYKTAITGEDFIAKIDEVKASFARTFTTKGYLCGDNDGIINTDLQNNAGLNIGRVTKVESLKNGLKKAIFTTRRELFAGDGIKFIRKGAEVGGVTLTSVSHGSFCEAYLKADVAVGDDVCLTKPKSLKYEQYLEVRINLTEHKKGEYTITVASDTHAHSVTFKQNADEHTEKPQSDGIKNVLQKGSAPLVVTEVEISLCSDVFLPFSVLNSERKRCLSEFKAQLLAGYKKLPPRKYNVDLAPCENSCSKVSVVLSDEECLDAVLSGGATVIYSPYDYSNIKNFFDRVIKLKAKVYFGLPTISFEKDIEVLCKTIEKYNTYISGLYGNNAFLQEIAQKYNLQVFKSYGANVTNNLSKRAYLGAEVTLSPELTVSELNGCDKDAYVYKLGYLPLMTLVHCPAKVNGYNCSNCPFDKGKEIRYSDKFDKLTVKRVKVSRCYFEVYSDKPVATHGEGGRRNILLDLRLFSPNVIADIMKNPYEYAGEASVRYCRNGVL